MTDILRLSNVTKTFQGFSLQDISFELVPGFITGLVGPNGSGKTTIIKLIMNMLHRQDGTITVDGLDNITAEEAVKQRIGYVSDDIYFVDDWRPSDVARALTLYYDSFSPVRFRQYLQEFGLPQGRAIKDFSRGMKTRLMLAAVLSRDTRLLLMDEPTSGLDPVVRADLLDLLQEYISDGKRSVLFSTHITTDLEAIADYIAFVYHGKLVFFETKDEALANYCMVKGRTDRLNQEWRQKFIGLRETAMGFEGLMKTGDVPPGLITEPATLDNIVVYHTRGGFR